MNGEVQRGPMDIKLSLKSNSSEKLTFSKKFSHFLYIKFLSVYKKQNININILKEQELDKGSLKFVI